MTFWGVEVKPGKPFSHRYDNVRGRLHISQATIGIGSSTKKSLVQCNVGDKSPVFLCALLPDKSESCPLDLEFEEDNEVIFSVIGPQSVHLVGYYIGGRKSQGNDDNSESYGEDIAETDTEQSTDYQSDDEYEDDFIDDGDPEVLPPSPVAKSRGKTRKKWDDEKKPAKAKSSRRRLNKKYQVSDSDSYKDDISQKKIVANGSSGAPVSESEDEDSHPISSLFKSEPSVKEKNTKDEENAGKETTKQEEKKKKKKKVEVDGNQSSFLKRKIDAVVEDGTPERNIEMDTNSSTTQNHSAEKKKKKKKKKSHGNDMNANVEDVETKDKTSKTNSSQVKNLPDGLIIEELIVGKPDGKIAAFGKKVYVHYIGKLKKNGQIFDSNIGGAPFKFRLGTGDVIKGWDVGVEGMRIGDKRRLLVPPSMGYGSEGAGDLIPPDSWLIFEVELIKVH